MEVCVGRCAGSLALTRIRRRLQPFSRRDTLRVSRLAVFSCVTGALAFGVAACGDDDSGGGGGGGGKAVTIYSSLPLQGANRGQSLDVTKGEKLALSQAG